MSKQSYTRPQASVLPPLPANTAMTYGQRFIKQSHLDCAQDYTQQWVITGLFPDATKQVTKALGKISAVYIDFDLVDSLAREEGMIEKAVSFLERNGVTSIFKKGAELVLAEIDTTDPQYATDIVKAMLSRAPIGKIKETVEAHFVPMMEQHIIPFIGKPQLITYTGHGAHAYYWLADDQGYTDLGSEHVEGDVAANADDYKAYIKSLFKHVNTQMGYDALDTKVSDLGTRCTRELGSENIKCLSNPKKVEPFLADLTAPDARMDIANFNALPVVEPVAPTGFTAQVAAAGAKGRGRPAAFKPMRVEHDDAVAVEVNGQQFTVTVEGFKEEFDRLMQAQGQVDKVRNCRLVDQLGQGSMNMYAMRTQDGEGIMFVTTASKYMKEGDKHWREDDAGNFLGYFLYDGCAMTLMRDSKGRIKKNTSNIETILANDPRLRHKIRFNSRLETVFIHRDLHLLAHGSVKREVRIAKNTEWFRLHDNHYITFEKMLNDYGLDNVSDSQMQRCLKAAAMKVSFDPVTDWIESIQWDGKRRLDGDGAWLCHMLAMPRNHSKWDLYAAYGRCVMMGIMRNIYIGNTYPDVQHVLTLSGDQGVGKSLCASVLALTEEIGMDYFHDSGIDMGTSAHRGDQLQSMLGCFLVELPEAISLSSSTTDASVKAFLTTKKDKGRMAYGREQSERLRSTYFITNSNDHIFLSDHTGNRRYLVVDCFDDLYTESKRLDIAYLRGVLPQLYAEAHARCVVGKGVPADRKSSLRIYEGTRVEDWNLTQEEREWQKFHNEKFTQPDYIVETLQEILGDELRRGVDAVSYAEVKRKLHKRDPNARIGNSTFANAMTRCGWRKATLRGCNRWLPTDASRAQARERVEPEAQPEAQVEPQVTFSPVAEDLDAVFALLNNGDFTSAISADALTKINAVADAIKASTNVQPAQVKLITRLVNRAIASL